METKDYKETLNRLNDEVYAKIDSLVGTKPVDINLTISEGVLEYTVYDVYREEDDGVLYVTYDDGEVTPLDGFDTEKLIDILSAIEYASKEKVYVLTYVDVSEISGETITVDVFKNREDARAALLAMKEEIKQGSDLWDKESPCFEDFTDTKDAFIIWEDGRYNNNHISIEIDERLIR